MSTVAPESPRRATSYRLAQVLWPSFLVAAAGTGLLFALVDPQELDFVALHVDGGRMATYSGGFLLLWALLAACSALTLAIRVGLAPAVPRADAAARERGADAGRGTAFTRRGKPVRHLRLLVDSGGDDEARG